MFNTTALHHITGPHHRFVTASVLAVVLMSAGCGAFSFKEIRVEGNRYVTASTANYALIEKAAGADGWTVAHGGEDEYDMTVRKGDKEILFRSSGTTGNLGYRCAGFDGDECTATVAKLLGATSR